MNLTAIENIYSTAASVVDRWSKDNVDILHLPVQSDAVQPAAKSLNAPEIISLR
jgi:hypothetical protein